MIYSNHPAAIKETERLIFLGIYLAVPLLLVYFVNEMILTIFRLNNREQAIGKAVLPPYPNWRMIDAGLYALAFILIAFQLLHWMAEFRRYEFRKLAKMTVLALIISAFFVLLFEWIQINMPVQQRDQIDLTVPFFMVLISHVWAILSFKQLIEKLGKHNKVVTGTSIFYILFAANPFIKFGLPVFLLIFISTVMSPYVFIFFSEIAMSYLVGVIAVCFSITLFRDARKISRAQLIKLTLDKLKDEEK
ncbi:MAG: hypothetical protein ACTSQE_02010 [Candidatus Heimdallarchaeaceae archaeon]